MQATPGGWDRSPGSYHRRQSLFTEPSRLTGGAEVRPQLRDARCPFHLVCGHNTPPVGPGQWGGRPHIMMGRGTRPRHMGHGGRGRGPGARSDLPASPCDRQTGAPATSGRPEAVCQWGAQSTWPSGSPQAERALAGGPAAGLLTLEMAGRRALPNTGRRRDRGQEKAEGLPAPSLLGSDGVSHRVPAGGGGPGGREGVGAELGFRGR